MPMYEYKCNACGEVFELRRKFSDPPLEECAKCGAKKKVEKLISNSSFALKGSGWYKTDYGSKGSGETKKKKAPACGESGSKPSCSGCSHSH